MPYDGFGNFTRSYNFTADKLAAIKIQSVRVDGEFDNYAAAMNQVLLRSGIAPMTGALKMGGNAVTGVAVGSAGTPSISFAGDVTSGIFLPSAGVLAFAVGGVERGRFNNLGLCITAGFLGINTTGPRTALDVIGISSVQGMLENTLITTTGISGAINIDANVAAVVVYDTNAAGNWTFNVRGNAGVTLDSLMAVGQTMTLAVEVPQGATPFYCTAITVDGAAPSQIKWLSAGAGAPTAGHASSIDVYAITIIKKAANTFYVRASQSQAK